MPPYLPSLEGHLARHGLPLVALVGQGVTVLVGELGKADRLDEHRQPGGQKIRPAVQDAKALHLVRSPRGHQGTTAVLRHRRGWVGAQE